MRLDIYYKPRCIPLQIDRSLIRFDITDSDILSIRLINIIFRADMHISHDEQGQLRHRVVPMRHTVVPARLIRDIRANCAAADTRCAERIQCSCIPLIPQLRGGEGGDGAAERMACYGDAVCRICGGGLLHGWYDAVSRVDPGVPEAAVCFASWADVRGRHVEVEICDPGVDGGAAAERYDDEVVGVVEGYEAGNVGWGFFSGGA